MSILKAVLFVFVAIMAAFILAGLLFANFRFFIWLGIIGLIIYAIYAMVTARRST